MEKISSLSFSQLKNAEHVSFFSNVAVAIEKVGVAAVGLTTDKMQAYKALVDNEQDIVNHSTASIYTPEMKAADEERDRLFRLIRLKLQAVTLADKDSDVVQYATVVDKYLLAKYGIDIVNMPYQEESALIAGFIMDVKARFNEDEMDAMGITSTLENLEAANNSFASQYNQRITEKSGSTTEATKRIRKETEEAFNIIGLHLEFKANTESATEIGKACTSLIAVVNEIIKDVKRVISVRKGNAENEEGGSVTPPYSK